MVMPAKSFARLVALAALLVVARPTAARDVGPYIRIEQDWELNIATPDPDHTAPQLFLQMYPRHGGQTCCQLLINYGDQPSYTAGGVQIQIWKGTTNLAVNDGSKGQAVLQTANEKITFTLVMQISAGQLTYSLTNLSSNTWGDVKPTFSVSTPDLRPNFQQYSTADTLTNSGILLGANRVTALTLKQVRKIDILGQADTESSQQLYP